jgi:UDP-GlcNAc:undecaprenyl-phosphate GlcNAc-1-phosphate transferase
MSRQDYRRRWYKGPTPLLGGLAIFAALIFTDLFFSGNINPLFFAILPLIFVGIIDDQREISYQLKLVFQVMSVASWIYITPVEDVFIYHLGLSPFWTYLFSAFWILSIINSINMIDGMDGLASGFGIVVCTVMLMLQGDLQNPRLILALAGGLCGFIYWNLKPAQIYLGGAGAHLIGFVLSTQLLTWVPLNKDFFDILIPLFIMAFPEVDILLTVVRRVRGCRSLFLGDGQYIYQKVLRAGFTVSKAWLLIMSVVGLLGLFATRIEMQTERALVVGLSVFMVVVFSYMLYLIFQMEEQRKDYFDQYLQNLFKEHLKPIDLVEVSAEDCLIVYSFSDLREELLRLKNSQLERWLVDSVQFIKTHHSEDSRIFMSSDGDLLVLDPKINGALKFHSFHQRFHDYMFASANHNEFWPLLLLKYMPIIEVGRLPGNIEISITELESGKVA